MSMPDIERYRSYVDRINATQTEKDEVIRIVWRIMEDFADRSFGLHPVQQCQQIPHEFLLETEQEHVSFPVQISKVKRKRLTGLSGGPS